MRQFIFRLILPILVFIIGVSVASIFSPARVSAQTCTTPAQVTGVLVSYPACDANNLCNFTQATCSWGVVSGAVSYQIKVTEVESGTIVYNQSATSTTTTVTFSITQNKTYKCDVSAVNSCGTVGPAGTHSLLCQVDAAVTTTPTTALIVATPTLVVKPTVPPVGSSLLAITTGIAAVFLLTGLFVFLI